MIDARGASPTPAGAEPARFSGLGREITPGPPSQSRPVTVGIAETTFTIAFPGSAPITATYRDLATVAVEAGRVLLVVGDGPGAVRLILEQLGTGLAALVSDLRERRARQMLADRFVDIPRDPLELVEYRSGDERGVAQLAYHPWGLALIPLDERRPWRMIRRASIAAVEMIAEQGMVSVTERAVPGRAPGAPIELPALGDAAIRHHDAIAGLQAAALGDASTLVTSMLPDAPFGSRRQAASILVDGQPADQAGLGDAWTPVEAALLVDPTFASTYHRLRARGGDAAWLALSPSQPGSLEPRAWTFVSLPGNLVAMELVTGGAHATYCYRVVPRAAYDGAPAAALRQAAAVAVADVSEALIDSRFLREPMALPADQLAQPRYLRYRLALAAIPSLAAARRRFVARLVHDDEERWASSLDALIAWHTDARDDAAEWPGRAAIDAAIGGIDDSEDPTEGGA